MSPAIGNEKIVNQSDVYYKCSKCQDHLIAAGFYTRANSKTGLSSQCKVCHIRTVMDTRKPEARARNNASYKKRRRANLKQSGFVFNKFVWFVYTKLLGTECLACGTNENIQQDHIKPLSIGGMHHPTNLQPLCKKCNERKLATFHDYRSDNQIAAVEQMWRGT